jgi:hypothetical protein
MLPVHRISDLLLNDGPAVCACFRRCAFECCGRSEVISYRLLSLCRSAIGSSRYSSKIFWPV